MRNTAEAWPTEGLRTTKQAIHPPFQNIFQNKGKTLIGYIPGQFPTFDFWFDHSGSWPFSTLFRM